MQKTLALILLACLPGWSEPVCSSLAEIRRHPNEKVWVSGVYVADPVVPPKGPLGNPDFKPGPRPFARSHLRLSDGEVILGPPMEKTCLRSPDEREDLDGRRVQALGRVETGKDPFVRVESVRLDLAESKAFAPRSLAQDWPGLKRWRFVKQTTPAEGGQWDLIRDYAVTVGSEEFQVRLFRAPEGEPKQPPPPRPNGEQVAFSTAPAPAHVGKFQVSGHVGGDLRQLIKHFSAQAFAAGPQELKWLDELPLDQPGNYAHGSLFLEISPQGIQVWSTESVESRRIYAEFEPRCTDLR